MIHIVSYDLKVPGRDYAKLYEVLKSGHSWWHYLESTWIISSNKDIETWSERIRSVLDVNDRFIIVDITRQSYNGWLPDKAWEWIRQQQSV
jgi:hypothetical protein